ncbi:L-ascorbate metabolism protein UlaG (beta-lactamase superfamily) [Mucilaginibacter oryzae]|uniref:L-ascorbate metabolism protein UlaG (Beta-lactamase superfamily) n=1 Tax=Mucilaginibacter oryzae TaxID=468058 RepID=A0A316GSD4_9SPHI|nr:MBL fold metallo-hydrolase [Mucilaginibacter oryzae]PWK65009.1 L-ascorbate metabolism protein UlaG (beta-lactamase superfamily) [Mucilaginibacter oryzae]
MNLNLKFLKPNVIIEPLVGRWYAWAHLVSPATAAMNVTGRHLKIMRSYVEAPELHETAVANPKMLGGPFMDYPQQRVGEIKELISNTVVLQADQISLAEAITELNDLLESTAKGYSLEDLYPKIPDLLKGYVELVYDLNNHPSFRFFEPLLYKSKLYNKKAQSIALWVTENDERPFCLSTAKLNNPDVLHLDIPFDHPAIDILSRMKRAPGDVAELEKLLRIPPEKKWLFESFFTEREHPAYRKYDGNKVRMRYFGHACILIETKNVSVLVDPLINYYGYDSNVNHYSDIDLPDMIDYVLITHNHQDHILLETLIPLRHKIKNLIVPATRSGALQDPNLKLMFNNIGFNNVIEVDELENVSFRDLTITGIPFTGEHSDLNIKAKLCYHVSIGGSTFLFVADSRVLESRLYQHVQSITGDVDVLFLGMECDGAPLSWLYGPLFSKPVGRTDDQSRRLSGSNFERGIQLVEIFHPKEVYVYAMGQEPWVEFISTVKYTDESNPIVQSNLLIDRCKKMGITAERLYGEKELLYRYKFEI